MDIEVVKKLIKDHLAGHEMFVTRAKVAQRYYKNKNDILYKEKAKDKEDNPLRNADNRISNNYYGLLVNQKAAYALTYPPSFDVEDDVINKKVKSVFGDKFPKICKRLCVDASNCTVGWLHIWKNINNEFKYAVVDPKQIIPIYTSDLEQELAAILRVYNQTDMNTGEEFTIYEYWTDTEVYAYMKPISKTIDDGLQAYNLFNIVDVDSEDAEMVSIIANDFGEVPFIPFYNNDVNMNDLELVKPLIDVYDKVFSGYVNDVEDIQEIVFILNNYGGTDLREFLSELKKYKTVDLQNDNPNDKSGLTTLTIDIPVEARNKLLEIADEKIFTQGQGVNPNNQDFGNATGIALKYLYSLLELKVGLMETEFRLGFGKLIRVICKYLGVMVNDITQTWTRCAIANDLETAEIAVKSFGIISEKSILKNHPYVEDVEEEIRQKEREKEDKIKQDEKLSGYGGLKPENGDGNEQ